MTINEKAVQTFSSRSVPTARHTLKNFFDLANTSALDTIVRSELKTQGETVADSRIFSLGFTEAAKSVQVNHAPQSKTAK